VLAAFVERVRAGPPKVRSQPLNEKPAPSARIGVANHADARFERLSMTRREEPRGGS
jgi:hypothetical protein